MGEFILKALVRARGLEASYYIESAAVSAEETGNPVYPPARRCLSQHGIPVDRDTRARQVTPGDYDRFDRIVCMDRSNLRLLRRIIPDDPEGKIHLLLDFTDHPADVADPWWTGDFETTWRDVEKGCQALLNQLIDVLGEFL